jgi:hypothetical protein
VGGIEVELLSVFIILAGLFSTAGAVYNWDWFMNARKARGIVRILGRTGARGLYGLLGAALMMLGILSLTGVIDLQT